MSEYEDGPDYMNELAQQHHEEIQQLKAQLKAGKVPAPTASEESFERFWMGYQPTGNSRKDSKVAWKIAFTAGQRVVWEGHYNVLVEAQQRGYLDHADSCRKGIDSKTCTCGIMAWLPSAMSGDFRRRAAQPDHQEGRR